MGMDVVHGMGGTAWEMALAWASLPFAVGYPSHHDSNTVTLVTGGSICTYKRVTREKEDFARGPQHNESSDQSLDDGVGHHAKECGQDQGGVPL